jgi:hypothetical protein
MTDCAQNYFLDKSLADECSGELEISNGFIVGRLADTWPEFRTNAENLRIQSVILIPKYIEFENELIK